jgi:hypothetical protein
MVDDGDPLWAGTVDDVVAASGLEVRQRFADGVVLGCVGRCR